MIGIFIEQWLGLKMVRGYNTLGTIVVMATIFAVMGDQFPSDPQGAQDTLGAGLTIPGVVAKALAVLEFK